MINPNIINLLQIGLTHHLNNSLQIVSHISIQLVYLFAAFEFAFFGIAWAFNRNGDFARLVIKTFYIGFIFFIIYHFNELLTYLIRGFLYIGEKIAPEHALKILSSPAEILRYGFDSSIAILKLAVHYGATNLGGSLLYLIIGFGALIAFAIIAAQALCLFVAFYCIALAALIILPLSVFSPLRNTLGQSIQKLLQAGIKIIILMVILSVATSLWIAYPLLTVSPTESFIPLLGFFFSVLVTLFLTLRLPNLAAAAVGSIELNLLLPVNETNVSVPEATVSPSNTQLPFYSQSTEKSTTALSEVVIGSNASATPAAVNVEYVTGNTGYTSNMPYNDFVGELQSKRGSLTGSTAIESRLSNKMIKQLKNTLKEIINEKKNKL